MSEQNKVIYGLAHNGNLMWYHHEGNGDGGFSLARRAGKKVGNGWSFKQVFSGGDGIIYAINANKDLMWARHDGRNDGSFRWASDMKKVGSGWSFKHVFSGGDGIIYAINASNDLMWARHDGRHDGTFRWASDMKKVGTGWDFKHVFSGGDGIIYAVNANYDLMWARHDGRHDGTFRWASDMKKVGNGWEFTQAFAGSDGVIYAVSRRVPTLTGGVAGGQLLWYRHDGRHDGTDRWAANSGKQVGDNWAGFVTSFAGDEGYHVGGAIGERYAQLGGPDSWLGWPASEELPFPEEGRVRAFEHGNIYWWPDTGPRDLNHVIVHYTGLHCFGETDVDLGSSDDEPYATLGVAAPDGTKGTFRSQIYEDVDAGEARFQAIELYRGRPGGLLISAVLQEHSGGDTEKSRAVTQAAVEAAGAALTTAATAVPYVGPVLGPATQIAYQWIKDDLIAALNSFVEETLGFADRPLGEDVIELTAKQMIVLATRPEGHAQFGPLPWRFETRLLQRFGASYKVYFNIFPG